VVSGFERNAYLGARRGYEKGESVRSLKTPVGTHVNTPSRMLARGLIRLGYGAGTAGYTQPHPSGAALRPSFAPAALIESALRAA
jgi:hypothetical protein